jgi:carbon monoxide dehydrogenase subunit G
MEMQGKRELAVTQQQAWESLNNPEGFKAVHSGLRQNRIDGA